MTRMDDLQELIDLCQFGEGESQRVMDLAHGLRSSDVVFAHIEQKVLNDLGRECNQRGICPTCGSHV